MVTDLSSGSESDGSDVGVKSQLKTVSMGLASFKQTKATCEVVLNVSFIVVCQLVIRYIVT